MDRIVINFTELRVSNLVKYELVSLGQRNLIYARDSLMQAT
jgi:hypothetical protein